MSKTNENEIYEGSVMGNYRFVAILVPGETVVTVTAADVECAMTGGVARAEVVMVLTNSVPAINPKRCPEFILEKLKLSATNSSVDATLKILKPIEESLVAFRRLEVQSGRRKDIACGCPMSLEIAALT